MSDPHAPRTRAASDAAALTDTTLLHDAATGAAYTYDDWLKKCVADEGRSREECVEQLMNAIARGDLTVDGPGHS